jgi:hypothetical protein
MIVVSPFSRQTLAISHLDSISTSPHGSHSLIDCLSFGVIRAISLKV